MGGGGGEIVKARISFWLKLLFYRCLDNVAFRQNIKRRNGESGRLRVFGVRLIDEALRVWFYTEHNIVVWFLIHIYCLL